MDNAQTARGRPFAKGNPGRPKGARNKTSVALEQLLEGQAEAIVGKVIDMALQGDRMAMRLAFDRVMGSRRERALTDLDLPPIRSARDCAEASAAVLAAVSSGEIPPGQGLELAQMVDIALRAFTAGKFDEPNGGPSAKLAELYLDETDQKA